VADRGEVSPREPDRLPILAILGRQNRRGGGILEQHCAAPLPPDVGSRRRANHAVHARRPRFRSHCGSV